MLLKRYRKKQTSFFIIIFRSVIMNLIDYIVTTYVFIDDYFKKFLFHSQLRKRGFEPKLTDSEVVTMEVVGEYLGLHTDTAIYRYFKRHWQTLFPQLLHGSNYVRHCANLWKMKYQFYRYLVKNKEHWIQILDSMPIQVCKFVRAKHSRLFKDSANYGKWCGQTFFGYRLHMKISSYGMIHNFILAAASVQDIHFVEPLLGDDRGGWGIADKGYRSAAVQQKLWYQRRFYLHTAKHRNEKRESPLPKQTIRKLSGMRRLIETVGGQLEEQFAIKTTKARDVWHLLNRIIRKIASHTFGVFLNMSLKRNPFNLVSLVD